ncbi:MAG: hypothetical protein AAF404_01860 [Pseudomonadota bacterium]
MGKVQDTVNRISRRHRHNAVPAIALTVPTQQLSTKDSFPTSYHEVAAMLVEQTSASYPEQLIGLTRALKQCNRVANTATERLKIVTLFRSQINAVLPTLRQQFINADVPYNDTAALALKCSSTLLQELAYGYKIALVDVLLRRSGLHRLDRAHAIYYAMRYLGECALLCSQSYRRWPQQYWRDINTLYWLAEQEHSAGDTIGAAATEDTAMPPTIARLYATLAMLFLSDNHQLSALQFEQLTAELAQHSSLSEPQKLPADPLAPTTYSVAINAAAAPAPHRYCNYASTDQVRFIDLAAISTALLQPQASHPQATLSVRQRRNITTRWGQLQPRRLGRKVSDEKMVACTGLTDCHALLMQPQQHPGIVNKKKTWQLINRSQQGLCLRGQRRIGPQLRIGQLIVSRDHQCSEPEIYIGVIRWINNQPKAQTAFGIELLGVGGKAVFSEKQSDYPKSWQPTLPALLLEPDNTDNGYTIILNDSNYQCGYRITVSAVDHSAVEPTDMLITFEVTQAIDYNTGFDCFRLTPVTTGQTV